MKTYLPQIERRIFVRPNPVFGIINYDADNAYPQRVLELVRQSPTAKSCWSKRTKFIAGNGFEVPDLGKVIVNPKTGLTLAKMLKNLAEDKGLYPGIGIHVNYNAKYQVVSASVVKYEDIRQGDTDAVEYRGKYVIYKDWGRKTWRSIYRNKFDVIDAFNPDPAVIKAQVIAAGGWDKYKGQLFYLTPVVDDYALCEFDAALEDIETEAGIKIFNNRQVRTGFLPSAMLFMKSRREEADNEGPDTEGNISGPANYNNNPSQLEQNLADFQGADQAQKIIVIEYEETESKPELTQYTIQNNDKLFEVTAKSVEGNIIKAFNVPKELVQSGEKSGLNNSGGEKREAVKEFNDITAPERMELSETFEKIFANWHQPINPTNNWNILEIPTEGAGLNVIQNSDKVQAIIESSKLTAENKIAILVSVYGLTLEDAKIMVPNDDFIKAAAAVPEIKETETLEAE